MKFYLGTHHPSHAGEMECAFISINSLRKRKKPILCPDVIIDSGAFTELAAHGRYREAPSVYAGHLRRLKPLITITAAVAQDYMCEPFMLKKTGLTVTDHQRLTIERYDALLAAEPGVPIMPVLQGYEPEEYVRHLAAYGSRIAPDMWVGVGSVCKRNGSPRQVLRVLEAIERVRPDLRLHGFGVKRTALAHQGVRALLHSADSMAWSFSARIEGRDRNSVHEAKAYGAKVEAILRRPRDWWQPGLL